jgi:chlorophyllide a reductase subunit X
MGGTTQILGLVVNRDDGSDTADQYARAVGLPILARIPLSRTVRELADACRLALEDAQFNEIFGDLAGRIARQELQPVENYTPLGYEEFLRVFGAEEPPGQPASARTEDLFGEKTPIFTVPILSLKPVIPQVQVTDPVQRKVQQMIEAIGMYVTDMVRSDRDGITVTSGSIEIRLGEPNDLEHKVAFLSALRRSGQAFSFVDLRYADAPTYR